MTLKDGDNARASLVREGHDRVAWIRSRMTMLAALKPEFQASRPFAGRRIGVSLHIEPKTAILLEVLKAGGAEIVATGNFGSTQDDVVAFLQEEGMTVFGRRADTFDEHHRNVQRVLDAEPDVLLDNGADLAAGAVARGTASQIIGATEETTSGGNRLRTELAGKVPFPSIVINDSPLKQIAENKHAVGQSVVESLMRLTNLMVPGRKFVVFGYGWCGRGIAKYLRGLGGRVAVVELDEIKALEAALDGYQVASAKEIAGWGEVFVTATGAESVLTVDLLDQMQSGALLANAGHFNTEIDVDAIRKAAARISRIDATLERIELGDGRHVVLVSNGRMINLSGRDPKGNSIESMDIGFMLQSLSLERVVQDPSSLLPGAQPVPDDINRRIARLTLAAMRAAN